MNKTMKIPRTLGTLIIAALLVVAISGCSGQANAHGAIESLSLGTDNITIVIDGQEIIINGDTEITGMLAEGTVIKVKFTVQDDGSLLAVEIEVEVEDDDEDTDDEDFEIEGTIDSLSDNTSIVVDGQTFLINGDTEIEGILSVNATVEVEYVEQDGSLLAVEIEVEDNDKADHDDDGDFEIEGTVESLSINQDGTGIVVIDGQEIIIDGGTEIEGILTANATAEVEYVVQDDGSLLALEIEVKDSENNDESNSDGDKDLELKGTIDSLSDNTSIVVNGQTFLINGDTEIEGILTANATVEVEYVVQNDGSLLAHEVKVEDSEDTNGHVDDGNGIDED